MVKSRPAGRTERRRSVQPRELLQSKGLRSRDVLKRAARELLNERGYRSLRVQDVAERAGVATGLFYRYFHDLREIVAEIAQDFFAELLQSAPPPPDREHRYDWIRANLVDVVRRFAANPGILACLFGLAGDYEEFDEIWKRNAHRWNLQVADFLKKEAGFDAARARRAGYMLGAMTEGVVYQALIRKSADLVQFAPRPEDVADALGVMWYRAIFLEDPPGDRLRAAGRRLVATPTARKRP
jgi:AcrR family transcriptional regulator